MTKTSAHNCQFRKHCSFTNTIISTLPFLQFGGVLCHQWPTSGPRLTPPCNFRHHRQREKTEKNATFAILKLPASDKAKL